MTVSRHSRDPLVWLSLAAGVGFTATAEYQLARTIGAAVPVAVLLPLALDVYVVAAIRRSRGRDIALSLTLMGIAQVAAHMLEAHVVTVSVPLVAAVSLLVPLSIWRVHALAASARAVPLDVLGPAALPRLVLVPVSVPVPAVGPAALPRILPVLAAAVSPPELSAVPEPASVAVPVRRPVLPARSAVRNPRLYRSRRADRYRPTPPPAAAKPRAVPAPEPTPVPVPARRPARKTVKPRTTKPATRGTGTDERVNPEHLPVVAEWLAADPKLSGTAIGKKLGTGDSYGRRVKRAALGTAAPGREPRPDDDAQGGEGFYP